MKKLTLYAGVSFLAVSIAIGNASYSYKQFYPTVVHLTTSKVNRVLLLNISFVILLLWAKLSHLIFFGKLHPRESERAHEKTLYAIFGTCFDLTMFPDPITSTLVAMVIICLCIKIFHWLAQSRQEYLEQRAGTERGTLDVVRLSALLIILGLIDGSMAYYFILLLLVKFPSIQLLLLLDYSILCVICLATFIRLWMHVVDKNILNNRWEGKGTLRFYLEIISDLLQGLLYMAFFCVMGYSYGIPIYVFIHVCLHIKSFHKTLLDFYRYRKLVNCLDKYPNATQEEIERDPQCIICYDDMTDGAKRLPCRHIFHKHCLKSWMERNSKCPYCNKETLLVDPPVDNNVPEPQPAAPAQPVVQPAQPAQPVQPTAQVNAPKTEDITPKSPVSAASSSSTATPNTASTNPFLKFYGQFSANTSLPTTASSTPAPAASTANPYQYYWPNNAQAYTNYTQTPLSPLMSTYSYPYSTAASYGSSTPHSMSLEEIEAYREFHRKMSHIYQQMSNEIMNAYSDLAANIKNAREKPSNSSSPFEGDDESESEESPHKGTNENSNTPSPKQHDDDDDDLPSQLNIEADLQRDEPPPLPAQPINLAFPIYRNEVEDRKESSME